MKKLIIFDKNVPKKIRYNKEYADGIYLVHDNKRVKRNCKNLSISLAETNENHELNQLISKYEKTGILTQWIDDQYFQYVFTDNADKSDVDRLINSLTPPTRNIIRTAFETAFIKP